MVLMLMLIARKVMNFEDYITQAHIGAMCKILVFTGSIVGLAYATELFTAWYSGSEYEQFAFANRIRGPMGWAYAIMVALQRGRAAVALEPPSAELARARLRRSRSW